MTADTLFQLSSSIALVGWLVLIVVSPFVFEVDRFLIGTIVTLLALVYVWLIISSFNPGDAKEFGSLDGVMRLFKNRTIVTAGWVHYLAFDLLAGIWIKRNSEKHGISQWLVVPCLFFTFMLGPLGLLLYLLTRWIMTKKYFSENYN